MSKIRLLQNKEVIVSAAVFGIAVCVFLVNIFILGPTLYHVFSREIPQTPSVNSETVVISKAAEILKNINQNK